MLKKFRPKKYIDRRFYQYYGKCVNWKNPTDINEIINWLKFHSDMKAWAILADKVRVREFIQSKHLQNLHLTKLYGVFDKADMIDFDSLPDSFVIKTNNRSGDTLIVKDKNKINTIEIVNRYNELLKEPFGGILYEPHYSYIKPKILIEEMLDKDKQEIESESLIDYKFWCFNGKPYCIEYLINRNDERVETQFFDCQWNTIPNALIGTTFYHPFNREIPKPKALEEMLYIVSRLSEGISVVRVDLYCVNDKIYMGEMTLTPGGGFNTKFTPWFMNELGKQYYVNASNNK